MQMTLAVIGALVVICTELTLWLVFRRKIAGLLFPREADQSFFKFFSISRLRLVAIFHTLFLGTIAFTAFQFLW